MLYCELVFQWLEKTQIVYNSKAQEAGIYVLEACGFDSIPAEMGLLHAKKQFDGTIVLCVLALLFLRCFHISK